ncbi:AAA domain-containing protein [Cryptosporangium aurantiacum]|uniref:Part of AAA domain-containing protein n=1 Tax=Cryptosporangium aurantiacum TaxID=134849 RepID=A0A1M7RFS0_9ACTN|nr:AAA domain-containing protein [Cryptosporangium aurantiacum]SHN45084.1 Part of AAA domain-containing protein [Cryptosporangium aurantiacum]
MGAATVGTDTAEALRGRLSRFAQYLAALRSLWAEPIRGLDQVRSSLYWQHHLPVGPGGAQLGDVLDGPWLAVRRVALPPPPRPSASIGPLVTAYDDPAREPQLRADWAQLAADRRLPLEAGPQGVADWVARSWRPWAEEAQEAVRIRSCYHRLFELRLAAERQAGTHELVWGHGVLVATINGHSVEYPLVVTPVQVEVDVDSASLTVAPGAESRLQSEMFEGLPVEVKALLELAEPGGVLKFDPWNAEQREDLYRRALIRLGFDPVVVGPDDDAPVRDAYVRDSGLLMLRPRRTALPGFLEQMRERIAEGTATLGALDMMLADAPSLLPDTEDERFPAGERVLFPLPANDQQVAIVRRLARHRLVAVQGPPGTGKTHTIANLICHLVANGQRVLVVAHREEPLAEVREKLPPSIRPLAVSVMGSSSAQLTQLQIAVQHLQGQAASLEPDRTAHALQQTYALLERAERDRAGKQAALRAVAERDGRTFRLDGAEAPATQVGEWLRAHESTYGFIPDLLSAADPFPLGATETTALVELTRSLSPEARRDAIRRLPSWAELPSGAVLHRIDDRFARAAARVRDLRADGVDVEAVRRSGRAAVTDLADALEQLAHGVSSRPAWVERIAEQIALSETWRESWVTGVERCREAVRETARWKTDTASYDVDIPADLETDRGRLLDELTAIRARLTDGKGLNRVLHRRLVTVRDAIRVNGGTARTVEDIDAVIGTLRLRDERAKLARRWVNLVVEIDGPPLDAEVAPEHAVGRHLPVLGAVLEAEATRWPELRAQAARYLPFPPEGRADPAAVQSLAERVSGLLSVHELDEADAERRAVRATLDDGLADAYGAAHWRRLHEAWTAGNYDDWDAVLADSEHLRTLTAGARRWRDLWATLDRAAPLWAARVAEATTLPDADVCEAAWRWRQADTWMREVIGTEQTGQLSRQIDALNERIRELTREITTQSAWLSVAQGIDDRTRDALGGWALALRKIGKKTGERAAPLIALAQEKMRDAQTAVPVWIMSADRAIQQFQGGTTPFDVVIVDEASQCGPFALPVLSLARRAVVVGDDKQIGPYAVGIPTEAVVRLTEQHLTGIPSREFFDLTTSVYDHALRRAPEKLMLTEHFRCVPEIITFSSIHWYAGAIQPLRTDRGGLPPIRTEFIPEGVRQDIGGKTVNHAEADALVETICRLAVDPRYDGKSFGVVSLLSGSNQAQYIEEALVERLGVQEMARRQLKVGDSYAFQGAERDVMFLSLVVSANDTGRIGAFTAQDRERRINVAASRAKDQMWVFHSVRADDLGLDDVRGKLLRYCADPQRPDEVYDRLEDRCESGLERAVLRKLVARGLTPVPQFPIGSYRVDFVVPAPDGRRLAIECDGDQYHGLDRWEDDLRRQSVLERVGRCVFWRVRGSHFARDPEGALAGLWALVAELGIGAAGEGRSGSAADSPVEPRLTVDDVLDVRPVPIVASAPTLDREPATAPSATPPAPPEPPLPPVPDGGANPAARQRPAPPAPPEPVVAPARVVPAAATPPAPPQPVVAPTQVVRTAETAPPAPPEPVAAPARVVRTAEAAPPAPPQPVAAARAVEAVPAARAVEAGPAARVSDKPSVPVPPGYRLAGWIRPDEAAAVLAAYEGERTTFVRSGGAKVGEARYYAEGTEEAQKFHANVALLRIRANGQERLIRWVKQYEAEAIFRAFNARQDLIVRDADGRPAGKVEFFPPDSAEAKAYRSTTRLLRGRPPAE